MTVWENAPSTATPLNAANLNALEELARGPFLNVKEDFGAVGDGVWNGTTYTGTDDTTRIQDALDEIKAYAPPHGATLVFPRSTGAYRCVGDLDLVDSVGVTFLGEGAASDAGVSTGWPGSALVFVGNGSGTFLDARSTSGFTLQRMAVMYVDTYTGTLIDLQHSAGGGDAQFFVAHQSMIAGAGTMGAHALVSMRNAIFCHVDLCHLGQAQNGVRMGEESVGSVAYSNSNTVSRSSFLRTVNAIVNPGEACVIRDNGFEGLQGGLSDYLHSAVKCDYTLNATGVSGLVFTGNWCGDAFGTQIWIDCGQTNLDCPTIEGNSFSGGDVGVNLNGDGLTPKAAGGAVNINNNLFSGFDIAVDLGDAAERTYNAVTFTGNDVSGCTSNTPLRGGTGAFDDHLHITRFSNRAQLGQYPNMDPAYDA